MEQTINILLTCKRCGMRKKPVAVRVRHPLEDVRAWLNAVMRTAGIFHRQHSPKCKEKVADVYVPLPNEGDGIGMSAQQKKEN